jgi:hypothetical protein
MENVRFEVFTAVILRCVALVRADVSEERVTSIIRVFLRSVCRLLVTTNIVPTSPIFVTLMLEELRSSETSVLTSDARRNIPEDGIVQPCITFSFDGLYMSLSLGNK